MCKLIKLGVATTSSRLNQGRYSCKIQKNTIVESLINDTVRQISTKDEPSSIMWGTSILAHMPFSVNA